MCHSRDRFRRNCDDYRNVYHNRTRVITQHTMTNQLTEELVYWELAEAPDEDDATEDDEEHVES